MDCTFFFNQIWFNLYTKKFPLIDNWLKRQYDNKKDLIITYHKKRKDDKYSFHYMK